MKAKTLHITIRNLRSVLEDFAVAYGKLRRGEHTVPYYGLSFADVDTFRRFLTRSRLELLHTVRQRQPKSLYELAKLLNRDLKSVNSDVALLKQLGLIQLEKQKHGRTRVIPHVLFDRMQVNIAIA